MKAGHYYLISPALDANKISEVHCKEKTKRYYKLYFLETKKILWIAKENIIKKDEITSDYEVYRVLEETTDLET